MWRDKISAYIKKNKKTTIMLLFLANAYVINVVCNVWSAEKGTPIWKSVTVNPIAKICNKMWDGGSSKKGPGMIMGVLYSEKDPSALIDNQLLYEGQTTRGVKVVKINAHEVKFEKNGQMWTQQVQERPHKLWRKCG